MSGGISQPAARIMLPTSSLTSIHQVVAYYVFSPNFLVKVQQKLKKKTCSNMFFAKRSNFLFSKCFKKKQSISLSLVTSMDGKTSTCLALPNALPSFLHPLACSTWIAWTPKLAKLRICGFPHLLKVFCRKTLCVDSITPNSNCWKNEGVVFGFSSRTVGLRFCPGSKTLPQQLQELRSLRCTCIACRNAAETLQIT